MRGHYRYSERHHVETSQTEADLTLPVRSAQASKCPIFFLPNASLLTTMTSGDFVSIRKKRINESSRIRVDRTGRISSFANRKHNQRCVGHKRCEFGCHEHIQLGCDSSKSMPVSTRVLSAQLSQGMASDDGARPSAWTASQVSMALASASGVTPEK